MTEPRDPTRASPDGDQTSAATPHAPAARQQGAMAAERTWLAWWRTALVATGGALAVGRVAPRVLHASYWPYALLGVGYAALAVGLLIAGAHRHQNLRRAIRDGTEGTDLHVRTVAAFTAGGVLLALLTIALVLVKA